LELTPNQYVLAYFIASKDKNSIIDTFFLNEDSTKLNHDLYRLYQKGYLENEISIEEVISLNELKVKNIFGDEKIVIQEKIEISDFDKFIDDWYELWPKGIYTGNPKQPIRSNKLECKTKLTKFLKLHKYPHQLLIDATKSYIERYKNAGWLYISTASYFIMKTDLGTKTVKYLLATECDNYLNKEDKSDDKFSRDV